MSDFVHCGLEGQLVSIAPLLLFKNRENEVLTSSRQLQLLLVRTFKNTQHQDFYCYSNGMPDLYLNGISSVYLLLCWIVSTFQAKKGNSNFFLIYIKIKKTTQETFRYVMLFIKSKTTIRSL